MSVLMRAIEGRLSSPTSQFNPAHIGKDEFMALKLAGLVGQSGWYLSGAQCWRFDRNGGERLFEKRLAQAIEAGTDETRNAAQPEGRERGPKGAPK